MSAQCRNPGAPLTVLHLSQPVEGGVARVVTDLAGAQARAGVHVVVGCPEGGVLARSAAAAGARVEHWAARRDPGLCVAAEAWRVRRLIQRVKPDLVHAHSAKAGLVARISLRGRLPTVYQPHAWSFEAVGGLVARLARMWERCAVRWTHQVLCVSRSERELGERAGITAPWTVVPNGVDLGDFPESRAAQGASCRAALPALEGVPPDALLVVCVGRLCRQKGQLTLLRAWSRIAEENPGAWLVLVGDGPDRHELGQEAPDRVLFAGTSEDVSRWYAAADLVVQPSLWEGMALTPLEAMACGRPVLLTDVGGARECLPPGQTDTCLVPPGAPEPLATAVIKLLQDPRLRAVLGEAAQQHVRAHFDVRRTAEAVQQLYQQLLGTTSYATTEWSAR